MFTAICLSIIGMFFNSCQQEKIEILIHFSIDDQKQELDADAEIIFVFDDKADHIKIQDGKILLPDFGTAKHIDVYFVSGEVKMTFKKLTIGEIVPTQEMVWEYRVDHPPFYEDYPGVDWSKVKKIHYWSFAPQEQGEGFEIIEPVL